MIPPETKHVKKDACSRGKIYLEAILENVYKFLNNSDIYRGCFM